METPSTCFPIRHHYGTCNLNILLNIAHMYGVPYEPLFAYSLAFNIHMSTSALFLGEKIDSYYNAPKKYSDILYSTFGIIRQNLIPSQHTQDEILYFLRKKTSIGTDIVPCTIDAFYDPSTQYVGLYNTIHDQGHGRLISRTDDYSQRIYYYATDISDPKKEYSMSYTNFFKACSCLIDTSREQIKTPSIPFWTDLLTDWFSSYNYDQMISNLYCFGNELACHNDLLIELGAENDISAIHTTPLFGNCERAYRSRGRTLTFFQYLHDTYRQYQFNKIITTLSLSIEQWRKLKALLIKYKIQKSERYKNAIVETVYEIAHLEETLIHSIVEHI